MEDLRSCGCVHVAAGHQAGPIANAFHEPLNSPVADDGWWYDILPSSLVGLLEDARRAAGRAVNLVLTMYWGIGRSNPGRYRVLWDRMAVDATLVDEIVHRVLSVARPDRIILFGSAATGPMTKDSDIDLLVVEPSPANTRERSVEIRDAVGNIGYPVDVIVMRTERFERTKRVIGGIAYPANKYGRVIYAAA